MVEGAEGARGVAVAGEDDDPTPGVQQRLQQHRAAMADLLSLLPSAPRLARTLPPRDAPRDTPRDTPRDVAMS